MTVHIIWLMIVVHIKWRVKVAAIVDNCSAQQEFSLVQQLSVAAGNPSTEKKVQQQLIEELNVFSVTSPTNVSTEHVKWRQKYLSGLLRSTKTQLTEEEQLPLVD